MSQRFVLPIAIGFVAGFATGHFLGLPLKTAFFWGAVPAAMLALAALHSFLQLAYSLGDGWFGLQSLPDVFALKLPRTYSGWVALRWMLIGGLVALGFTMLIAGGPRHDRRRFDQFTISSGEYSLRLLVPAGARSDETVVVTAHLQRFPGGGRLPTSVPTLQEPSASITARPMEPSAPTSQDQGGRNVVQHSWALRAPAGRCLLSLDYGARLFAGDASVEGLTLPDGRAIADAARRIEVLPTGSRSSMEVFTVLGLTAHTAALAGAIGSVVGFALTILSAYREGKRQPRGGEPPREGKLEETPAHGESHVPPDPQPKAAKSPAVQPSTAGTTPPAHSDPGAGPSA